jgi:POT family proton-dependent oligopeptide transporter
MAYGCFGNAAAYLIMWLAAVSVGDGKASWLWLMAYFVVLTIAELYLSPIALSLVSKVAPLRYLSMMMGTWLATIFVGNFVAGYLGSFWSGMDKGRFFLMITAVAALAGLIMLAFVRPLKTMLRES